MIKINKIYIYGTDNLRNKFSIDLKMAKINKIIFIKCSSKWVN